MTIGFKPVYTINNSIAAALTVIERARGFLEAASLFAEWIRRMGEQALVREAHHTTHIEGTRLTLEQSERIWAGKKVTGADPDDAWELLNFRKAFVAALRHRANTERYRIMWSIRARPKLLTPSPRPMTSPLSRVSSCIGSTEGRGMTSNVSSH